MLPSNSNLSKENCSSTSSNCVVWQGPDIACIDLCNGDTISDVTYKLAEEICELKKNIGVSDVDLTCLVDVCQRTPEPSKTLSNILDLLINKVCCLSDIIKSFPTPTSPFIEPVLTYPVCTVFATQPVNDLHRDFTRVLAQKICELGTKVTQNTSDIANHEIRITALEQPKPVLKLASCLLNQTVDYNILLANLETEFCDILETLGGSDKLTVAISAQCKDLGTQKSLIDSTIQMRSISSPVPWIATPQTFAESVQNLWITVCDMRAAVRSILDNCCKAGCDDIKIDAYIKWKDDPQNDIVLLNFRSKSKLPVGFYDCGQTPTNPVGSNQFTITDATGFSIQLQQPVLFRSIKYPTQFNGGWLEDPIWPFGWIEWDLTSAQLDLDAGPLIVTAELCFTDGTIQCINCIEFVIPPKPVKCCEVKILQDTTIVYKTC